MIYIIFNTYQSFTYLHIVLSNYPQKGLPSIWS